MTYEEALNWLDEHLIKDLKVKEIISKSLEKQIPKKPFGDGITAMEYCPNCKRQLRTFVEVESHRFHGYERETLHANYCENCGQSIDWSDACD